MASLDEKKGTAHVEHNAVRNYGEDDHTIVKAVQNVALADAAAKDRPRLFTKNMFMVLFSSLKSKAQCSTGGSSTVLSL